MRKLRILVGADVPKDPNSGAAGTVYQTNMALRELGHEVDEFWAEDIGRRIKHGNLHYLLELPRRYRDIVRKKTAKKQYDVIQLSQPHAYLAAKDHQKSCRHGIFINRSHGVEPKVNDAVLHWSKRLGVHNGRFPESALSTIMQNLIGKQWPAAASYSDGIIVPCQDDREYLINRLAVKPDKICVIHHGIPAEYLEKQNEDITPDRRKRILSVAQFSFFKGPHILATVINEILKARRDVTFSWVCSKEHHREILRLFAASIRDRVNLIDWTSQEQLLSIYDEHGIFVFTSLAEGAAKATLEALARGLCVVASDNSGMKDYITHGKNGLLAPTGDTSGFKKNVEFLLNSETLCLAMSRKAREMSQQYTWRRCAEGATVFYESLLASKGCLNTQLLKRRGL